MTQGNQRARGKRRNREIKEESEEREQRVKKKIEEEEQKYIFS